MPGLTLGGYAGSWASMAPSGRDHNDFEPGPNPSRVIFTLRASRADLAVLGVSPCSRAIVRPRPRSPCLIYTKQEVISSDDFQGNYLSLQQRAQIRGPLVHELGAFFKHIATLICPLSGITHSMRQRRLNDFTREAGLLSRPGAEG